MRYAATLVLLLMVSSVYANRVRMIHTVRIEHADDQSMILCDGEKLKCFCGKRPTHLHMSNGMVDAYCDKCLPKSLYDKFGKQSEK